MKRKWAKSNLSKQIQTFIVVGVINTGIDLLVLNLLIHITHQGYAGPIYRVYKSIAFIAATSNSYWMNKHWTFAGHKKKQTHWEIAQFFTISIIAFLINVNVAGSFVDRIAPVYGLQKFWPSLGALCGTAVGLFWNFIGYKVIVFQHHHDLEPPA